MTMSKAPDGMPTQVIEQMIENGERELRQWEQSEKEHYEGLKRALNMQDTIQVSLNQMRYWLSLRRSETQK